MHKLFIISSKSKVIIVPKLLFFSLFYDTIKKVVATLLGSVIILVTSTGYSLKTYSSQVSPSFQEYIILLVAF